MWRGSSANITVTIALSSWIVIVLAWALMLGTSLDGVLTHMSEGAMTVGAATFELGIPLLSVIALMRAPRLRRFAVVLLGAITPAAVFYVIVIAAHLINPSSQSNVFAYYAAWVMTFFVYVTLVVIGGALAFLPKPSNLYARFFVGLAATPLTFLLLKYAVFVDN